jgi:hypothetical protein
MRLPFIAVIVALCLVSVSAEGQTTKRKPKPPKGRQATVSLHDMEVGQEGFLTFGEGKGKNTLYPVKVGDVEEGQFIGLAGVKPKVIVRGVDTEGLVSDRYYQLAGAVKVTGTEKVSNGATVFVLEPVDPKSFALQRSEMPSLVIPQ